jgi:HPt (histidine-containing phosphotransfer) domain-containing protein
VAANLGAEALARAAAAVEKHLRTGQLDVPADAMKELAARLDEVAVAIAAIEPHEVAADPQGPVDVDAVRPLLTELAGLLETDLAAAVDRLDSLRGLLAQTEAGAHFKRLEEHMDDFDTDQALETLEEIARMLAISLES